MFITIIVSTEPFEKKYKHWMKLNVSTDFTFPAFEIYVKDEFKRSFEDKYRNVKLKIKELVNSESRVIKKTPIYWKEEVYVVCEFEELDYYRKERNQGDEKKDDEEERIPRRLDDDNDDDNDEKKREEKRMKHEKVYKQAMKKLRKDNRYEVARKLFLMGFFKECYSIYKDLSKDYKKTAKGIIYKHLATIMVFLGRYEACGKFVKKYQQFMERDDEFYAIYAQCCYKLKDYEEAMKCYQFLHQRTGDQMFELMNQRCLIDQEVEFNTEETINRLYEKNKKNVIFALEKCSLEMDKNRDIYKVLDVMIEILDYQYDHSNHDNPLKLPLVVSDRSYDIYFKFMKRDDCFNVMKHKLPNQKELGELAFKFAHMARNRGNLELCHKFIEFCLSLQKTNFHYVNYKLDLLRIENKHDEFISYVRAFICDVKNMVKIIDLKKVIEIIDSKDLDFTKTKKVFIKLSNPDLGKIPSILVIDKGENIEEVKKNFYSEKNIGDDHIPLIVMLYDLCYVFFSNNQYEKIPFMMELLQKFEFGYKLHKRIVSVHFSYLIVSSLTHLYLHSEKYVNNKVDKSVKESKIFVVGDVNTVMLAYEEMIINRKVYRIYPFYQRSLSCFDLGRDVSKVQKFVDRIFDKNLIPVDSDVIFFFGDGDVRQAFVNKKGYNILGSDDIDNYFDVLTRSYYRKIQELKKIYKLNKCFIMPLIPTVAELHILTMKFNYYLKANIGSFSKDLFLLNGIVDKIALRKPISGRVLKPEFFLDNFYVKPSKDFIQFVQSSLQRYYKKN